MRKRWRLELPAQWPLLTMMLSRRHPGQDEPTGGRPDATLTSGELSLRAERDGSGNGRVYHVAFTATDAFGAACNGEVTVCVPHDQGQGDCGDGGPLYPSGVL